MKNDFSKSSLSALFSSGSQKRCLIQVICNEPGMVAYTFNAYTWIGGSEMLGTWNHFQSWPGLHETL